MSTAHEAAFLDAVPALRPRVHRYCTRMIGSVIEAEDLTQETLAQAHRKLDALQDPQRLEAWVFRIAHRKALDFLRRSTPEVDATIEAAVPPEVPPVDVTPALAAMLVGLPPRERAAVILKDVLELSLVDVAEVCQSTVGAVKAALHRGRAKLTAGLPIPAVRSLTPDERTWIDGYLDAFNRLDWDAVCALTRADVDLEVVEAGRGRGHAFLREGYFRNYMRIRPWRFARARVGTEELVVQFRPTADGGWRPHSVMHLELREGALGAARDFVHVEYLLDGLEVTESG